MNNIKKLRGSMGISQSELAKKIGLTRAAISLLERNTCHSISYDNAKKMSEIFGCSVIELYGIDNLKIFPKNDEERKQLLKIVASTLDDEEEKEKIIKVIGT